jgi:hypothetical protein
MKKLLMIGTLCLLLLAFVGTASADWPFKGDCTIDYIKLYWATLSGDDVPVKPCELWLHINVSGEIFKVFCYAEGTQLNLALLKAFNADECVSCDGSLELTPITIPGATCPDCKTQGFRCWIKDIDFGTPDP